MTPTRATVAMLVAPIILTACGAAPDPDKRMPGMWETSMTVEKLELTGVPDGMAGQAGAMREAMKTQFDAMNSLPGQCLTPEAAEAEDPAAGFKQVAGNQCEFERDTLENGTIDVTGVCNMGGQEMDVTMTGTMTPERIDMTMNMQSDGETSGAMVTPGVDTTLKMEVVRTGDC